MGFSNDVVEQAWKRCGGSCECRRAAHDHLYIDVINNWSGITEAGKAVEHGRHTIRMQMVVIVLVTVKFSVGTVIKGRKASAAKKFYYSRY